MMIAMVYGAWSVGSRPFNMSNLWDDPRGLTGSELSFFCMAREMRNLGHRISIFTRYHSMNQSSWEGCDIFNVDELTKVGKSRLTNLDAVCSWNEPDMLRGVSPRSVRFVNQQLNDFDYCQPGFDDFVDVYSSPSDAHKAYITKLVPRPDKWEVLHNGCDPFQYPEMDRVPGRVIYASSPDRGLHLLLQEWPKIRKRVPNAHLRVFYNFHPWFEVLQNESFSQHPDVRECCFRAMYIREAMRRLKSHGVEHLHSISRVQMAREMSQARVLAYPCDTIRYTEGFSVTLMEACAAGVLPVTSSVDALGDIYGQVVPMVKAPVGDNLDEFVEYVIRGLTDEVWRRDTTERTLKFAHDYKWSILARRFENILRSRAALK